MHLTRSLSSILTKLTECFWVPSVSAEMCEQIAKVRRKVQRIGKDKVLFLDETYKRVGDAATATLVLPGEPSFIASDVTVLLCFSFFLFLSLPFFPFLFHFFSPVTFWSLFFPFLSRVSPPARFPFLSFPLFAPLRQRTRRSVLIVYDLSKVATPQLSRASYSIVSQSLAVSYFFSFRLS